MNFRMYYEDGKDFIEDIEDNKGGDPIALLELRLMSGGNMTVEFEFSLCTTDDTPSADEVDRFWIYG